MKDIKKEFMEKFKVGDNLATFCCGGDLCEGHLDDLEELWSWFESKLNEVREEGDRKVLKVAGVKLDGLEPEDIKVIADVLLMRKSRKLKPTRKALNDYIPPKGNSRYRRRNN